MVGFLSGPCVLRPISNQLGCREQRERMMQKVREAERSVELRTQSSKSYLSLALMNLYKILTNFLFFNPCPSIQFSLSSLQFSKL